MTRRFGAIRYKPTKTRPRYIEASYLTPVWAYHVWPGLAERQYANFDLDDEDGARAWLRQAKLQIDARSWQPEREQQRDAMRQRLTLDDYFPMWLEGRRTSRGLPLERGSAYRYQRDYDNHIRPMLGRMRLVDITPRDCDRWWDRLDHSQESMCVNALKTLKAVLASAATPGPDGESALIPANPCHIRTPSARRRSETVPATPEQAARIRSMMPDRYRETVYISLWCNGLRIGEVCALQRQDVDLDRLLLHVRRSRKTIGPDPVGRTKSDAGERDENIPPQYAPSLRLLLDQCDPEPTAWLFPSVHDPSRPLHPNTLRAWYDAARRKAGRPDLRFHDLRHTALTLLAQQGATVRELMDAAGHADPQTAMRYQHSVSGRARDLARRIGGLIPTGGDDGVRVDEAERLREENRRLREQLAMLTLV